MIMCWHDANCWASKEKMQGATKCDACSRQPVQVTLDRRLCVKCFSEARAMLFCRGDQCRRALRVAMAIEELAEEAAGRGPVPNWGPELAALRQEVALLRADVADLRAEMRHLSGDPE